MSDLHNPTISSTIIFELPEVCTPKEIARAVKGFTERDIKEDCRKGKITHYRRNAKIVIHRDDFYAYMETLRCPRKTQDRAYNLSRKGNVTTSSGSNKETADALAHLQTIINKRKSSSKILSKGKRSGNIVKLGDS